MGLQASGLGSGFQVSACGGGVSKGAAGSEVGGKCWAHGRPKARETP